MGYFFIIKSCLLVNQFWDGISSFNEINLNFLASLWRNFINQPSHSKYNRITTHLEIVFCFLFHLKKRNLDTARCIWDGSWYRILNCGWLSSFLDPFWWPLVMELKKKKGPTFHGREPVGGRGMAVAGQQVVQTKVEQPQQVGLGRRRQLAGRRRRRDVRRRFHVLLTQALPWGTVGMLRHLHVDTTATTSSSMNTISEIGFWDEAMRLHLWRFYLDNLSNDM